MRIIHPFIFAFVILSAGCSGSGNSTQQALAEQVTQLQGEIARLEADAGTAGILRAGSIKHTVMFDLKHDPAGAEAARFLDDGRRILSAIPSVRGFEVFRQVSPKNDFQFGFSMVFDDREGYRTYNDHPDHVKFVKERWDTEVVRFQEADFVVPGEFAPL